MRVLGTHVNPDRNLARYGAEPCVVEVWVWGAADVHLPALPCQGFQTDLEAVATGQGWRMTGRERGAERLRGKNE